MWRSRDPSGWAAPLAGTFTVLRLACGVAACDGAGVVLESYPPSEHADAMADRSIDSRMDSGTDSGMDSGGPRLPDASLDRGGAETAADATEEGIDCGPDDEAGIVTLSTTPGYLVGVYGIAVDAKNVYWTDEIKGTIRQTPIGGGPITTLATSQKGAMAVTVDATNVYWTVWGAGIVATVPIGGGATKTLATGQGDALGVLVAGGNVYWATLNGYVLEMPLAGGAIHTIATESSPWYFASTATDLYWTDSSQPGNVVKAPLGGGTPTTLVAGDPGPIAIATNGVYVYWTSEGYGPGNLKRIAVGGGSVTTLASWGMVASGDGEGIALDETNVYWTDRFSPSVMRVPIDGGTPTTFAALSHSDYGNILAIDACYVYWTSGGRAVKKKRK